MGDPGEFLTVEEVAAICRVHPKTVRGWAHLGSLNSFLVGQKRLVRRSDLDAYLATCEGPAVKRPGGRAPKITETSDDH